MRLAENRGIAADGLYPPPSTRVTDLATVTALTVLFIKPSVWIVPFALISVLLIVALPLLARPFFGRYGDRVIEPEIKLVFAALFLLMWLGARAHSQAVLPAFIVGLVMSEHYDEHQEEQKRLRVVAFAFLTPFFFLKGGMNVSASALWGNLGVLALLFVGKMVPKLAGVYPLARRHCSPYARFATLDRKQFSLLVAVVVLSAIVPTVIAQRLYQPRAEEHRDLTAPVAPAHVHVGGD
jgi:Kef-type K+ transport system membrane component KefB